MEIFVLTLKSNMAKFFVWVYVLIWWVHKFKTRPTFVMFLKSKNGQFRFIYAAFVSLYSERSKVFIFFVIIQVNIPFLCFFLFVFFGQIKHCYDHLPTIYTSFPKSTIFPLYILNLIVTIMLRWQKPCWTVRGM